MFGDWLVKSEFNGRTMEWILSFGRDAEGNQTGQWIGFMGVTDLTDVKFEEGKLSFEAGKAKMTQINPLAVGDKVHIAGTFDGKLLKLYTGGSIYKRWNWRTVWTYPAAISGVLLLLMVVFFKVPPAEQEEEQAPAPEGPEADAAAAMAEQAPAEPEDAEGEGGEGDA